MLQTLDAAALRRWCAGGLAALERHQDEINQLNVYPVPDGDTGTNLVLTLTSAEHALRLDPDDAADAGHPPHGRVLRLLARGALLGARGNSGVIVSQILRGLADALCDVPVVRGRALAAALRTASTTAYAAVARPVEGTVLSVAVAAATAAERADTDDLPAVARAAASAADEALARTPEQLPALARAGVVDAGGRGLCVLLDALVEVVTGDLPVHPCAEPPPAGAPRPPAGSVPPAGSGSGTGARAVAPSSAGGPATTARETGSPEYAYEVQFLLDAAPPAVRTLRAELDRLGDSLVVVGDGSRAGGTATWNVHVHVNDVGAAIEAGVVAGRPYQISVTRFEDQVPEPVAVPVPTPGTPERAAVVVAAGPGLAAIFTAEGATVVDGNPSAGELLDAIRSTGASRVVVLPNDPNTQAVAGVAAQEAQPFGVRVSVVPTRSPVQALAALAVRDPARRFADDVIAMAEAAGACRYAEICHASREALTVAGPCQPGDVLGLVDGEVHLIGSDLVGTCEALLDRMLGGGGELVTLLLGVDAPDGLAETVRAHLARRWPFVEVHHYSGGQPFYPLLVGVE
ncbi:DAK2 domain-containing protein [Plantactinospora soyae]|uniref:DAK2 domain fusion protein YloV n=1 Tax=Plantactinospora soyae TaxID=1544732 RepID=A0A927M419_9ACTN|nr:DAK2 domain-containing protein [Plantactinospora soyae]MBE1487788.1 DAK2 domain fusion protein YloV [Plantactinospora soyae]